MKNLILFLTGLTLAMGISAADNMGEQCQLKNQFAEKILLLAKQIDAVCSDSPESVLAKLAAKEIAEDCKKRNLMKAVTLDENQKTLTINPKKLEYGDRNDGDPCLVNKVYQSLLKQKVALLKEENDKLKAEEKIRERNKKTDQILAERRSASEAYWNTAEGKAELEKRIKDMKSAVAIDIKSKNATIVKPIDVLKDKLRKCGVTSETKTTTTIEQSCKQSLNNNNYDEALSSCAMAFNCQL